MGPWQLEDFDVLLDVALGPTDPGRSLLPPGKALELLTMLSPATWWSLWNCMVLSGSLKLVPRQPRPPSSSSPAARGSPHTQNKTPAPTALGRAPCYLPGRTYRYPTCGPPPWVCRPSRTHEDSSSEDRLYLPKKVPAHSKC